MNGSEVRSATAAVETPALELRLDPNHPNPFNPQTTIPYSVPSGLPARVRLVIYDTAGRTVRVLVDEEQAGGVRSAVWNGTNSGGATVSSGVYYCVLQVGSERRSQKMVLLK
jgi:flagellar hook assembly protein FlgD